MQFADQPPQAASIAPSIQPPPSTMSSWYTVTTWPGAIAVCGVSNITLRGRHRAGKPGPARPDAGHESGRDTERVPRCLCLPVEPAAVRPAFFSAVLAPSVTVRVAGSICTTYRGVPSAMPSPLRWPIVNASIPECSPTTVPSWSTIAPAVSCPGRARVRTSSNCRRERNRFPGCPACHGRQAVLASDRGFRTLISANRKEHVRQELASEPEQHVRLILSRVEPRAMRDIAVLGRTIRA